MKEEIRDKHPAYGTVSFSRVSVGGKGMEFFGSELRNSTAIKLSICEAEVDRDLSKDWVYPKKQLVEVYLSPDQFATLITTMNYGEGACCTITRLGGESVESIETIPDKKVQFQNEMLTINDKLLNQIKAIEEKIDAANIGKKKKEELVSDLGNLHDHLSSNIPSVQKQFDKHMDKVSGQMKAEIESFITVAVNNAGIEALKDKAKLLIEE